MEPDPPPIEPGGHGRLVYDKSDKVIRREGEDMEGRAARRELDALKRRLAEVARERDAAKYDLIQEKYVYTTLARENAALGKKNLALAAALEQCRNWIQGDREYATEMVTRIEAALAAAREVRRR